jgi:hypothetical protein
VEGPTAVWTDADAIVDDDAAATSDVVGADASAISLAAAVGDKASIDDVALFCSSRAAAMFCSSVYCS